jgi:putative addiction module killer protein
MSRARHTYEPQLTIRIDELIDRLSLGNPGDARPIGQGVSQVRIDYGQGYRVYFASRGKAVLVLLCGGDKQTQKGDIVRAKALAKEWNNGA